MVPCRISEFSYDTRLFYVASSTYIFFLIIYLNLCCTINLLSIHENEGAQFIKLQHMISSKLNRYKFNTREM